MSDECAARPSAVRGIFEALNDVRHLSRGDRLHATGMAPTHIFLVTHGWIGRSRANSDGDAAFTGVHIAGDLVGADAIESGQLDDDVFALSEAWVLRAPIRTMRERIARDNRAAVELIGRLAGDSAFLREAIFAIGRQPSVERLSTFLIQTYHRLARAGLIADGAGTFPLPMTQAQLGAATGLTAIHVSRVLKVLRNARYVDVRGGVVRVLDAGFLEGNAPAEAPGKARSLETL